MTPLKWFSGFLKKYRLAIVIGLVLMTVIVACAIVNPYISGMIVDDVIQGGAYDLLPKLIGIMLAVTAVRAILRYATQMMFETCSQGVLYRMRDAVYRKLLQEDFAFYNRNRTGDLMSRQTGDMDAIRHFVAFVIYTVYENILMFIFALVMIFMVNVKLALCMMAVLPFCLFTTYLQSKYVKPKFHECRQSFSSLNAFVQENISGNRVVKAFAKEEYEKEKFEKENDKYREAELGAASIWCRFVPIFELLSNLLMVVLILYGGYQVICGEMTLGNLVTVNGYLWMLSTPLRFAGWWVNDVQRFITSVEKIYDTYSKEPDVKKPKKGIKRKEMQGNIEFRNVSYEVEGEDIIHNISFSVEKGQTVGILGSTGAGKSTIMNLLCRFYDVTEGEVLVDGIDVKNWDLHDLRDNIGMAMQDVFLFSDTIEGNIAYGKPDCTFEEVKEAAVMSDANLFIKAMPDGYETIVGERGVGLSGGQKQRISLARALLKKPSILILDDTTSAVDMETESYIQEQLKKLGRKHTVFVIAYRISSIKDADVIFVMDEGRIVERGNHESLLKQNGYYATVYKHQNGMEG
ncbi:MAG: ABC transporter ATP-binding protein [Eubacterium sp.]|nr:ABC transporter ATP-binding protein [Eubacterium sp.]